MSGTLTFLASIDATHNTTGRSSIDGVWSCSPDGICIPIRSAGEARDAIANLTRIAEFYDRLTPAVAMQVAAE